MKKNILILINRLSDYTCEVIEGIYDYFKNKDVNIILDVVRVSSDLNLESDYPFLSGLQIAQSTSIDAVIVLSAIFCSNTSKEDLALYLKKIKCKNIISIGVPLDLKNCRNTSVSSSNAYNEIISHLKEKHNCKNFAYMSATKTGSIEAEERFDSFIKAIKNNNLNFNPDLKFEGYFLYDVALKVLKEKYHNKNEINFDAILAANDVMAFACMDFLKSLGLKIPKDIKVIGFDDITQASSIDTPLSTINQQIFEQGQKAAELAFNLIHKKSIPQETKIEIKPIFRKSCCNEYSIKKDDSSVSIKNHTIKNFIDNSQTLQTIYFLLETMQNEINLDNLFTTFESLLPQETIPGIAICLFDKPVICSSIENVKLPEKVKLSLYIDKIENTFETNLCEYFNPKKQIVPSRCFGKEPGLFSYFPISYGNKQFGYYISKLASRDYLLDNIYQRVYANSIAQAYIFTQHIQENAKLTIENIKLQLNNTELEEQSYTDVLTSIFNRRGFLTAGQDSINLCIKMKMNGIVCFGDMDNLKMINDTYGHEFGDKAIQTQAEILQKVIRKNDVLGRIGGDEFAFILPGISEVDFIDIKNKIEKLSEQISKEKNLPFVNSISIGTAEFSKENKNINELLIIADKKQYIEKHNKHAERK